MLHFDGHTPSIKKVTFALKNGEYFEKDNMYGVNFDSGIYISMEYVHKYGALNFLSSRGVQPRFPKCGACKLIFASERGALWTEIFKSGGLRAKIWAKIETAGAKISIFFSQNGVLWADF